MNKKKGLRPLDVPAFAGVNIHFLAILIKHFRRLIRAPQFAHEPTNMLYGGPAVQPTNGKPAFRIYHGHGGAVAYQRDCTVVVILFFRLCALVLRKLDRKSVV